MKDYAALGYAWKIILGIISINIGENLSSNFISRGNYTDHQKMTRQSKIHQTH